MLKPLNELSPAYRQRIERGIAAGLTRSQSRGHSGIGQVSARIIKAAQSKTGSWEAKKIIQLSKNKNVDRKNINALNKLYEKSFNFSKEKRDKIKKETNGADDGWRNKSEWSKLVDAIRKPEEEFSTEFYFSEGDS